MEINVMGSASKFYKPDQVTLQLTFEVKDNEYKIALDKGLDKVLDFVNYVLIPEDFMKEDLKTSDFYINEEQIYDEKERKYIFSNYVFKQNAFLSFPYEVDKLSNIISKIGDLNNPPLYEIDFDLHNKEEAIDEVLTMAFNDSKRKANVIACSNNKTLKECLRVEVNDNRLIEPRNLLYGESSISNNIKQTFTPRNIEISQSMSTSWRAF